MSQQLKSFKEIRKDLTHTPIARFYYQAAKRMISQMFDDGVLPKKEPLIRANERKTTTNKKWNDFWNYHLYKQMLNDVTLIDAYLLGEEIVPKYGTKVMNGKEYVSVKFYPAFYTKIATFFIDYDDEE